MQSAGNYVPYRFISILCYDITVALSILRSQPPYICMYYKYGCGLLTTCFLNVSIQTLVVLEILISLKEILLSNVLFYF